MTDLYQLKSPEDREALMNWWKGLGENRGARAILRRASKPDDVLLTSAFSDFLKQMPDSWHNPGRLLDSAIVAAALSHVRENDSALSFAQALASPRGAATKAAMSELRFLQLQKSRDPDEFYRRIHRAIALLGGRVNVLSIADGILHWMQEYRRIVDREPAKRLAVRWASDYYTTLKD
ncbi:type I-E CRISPR-associated protein Cse2/CasB [Hahella sp. SMD15-11]|uniref:Type I-E CRISPR-associated protein Cse2/CasB n=1 Tax=Thermohahella caldifontis TaxID=3142973 RepID=A0AB39UUG5_9GAMM